MKIKDASRLIAVEYKVPKGMDENSISYGIKIVFDAIKEIPEMDVEPVVRCKDCISCYKADDDTLRCSDSYGRNNTDRIVAENFFCSDGERKDNG